MGRTVSAYLRALRAQEPSLMEELARIYGSDEELLAERRRAYEILLERFAEAYGEGPVWIARAPGRVNLMGRHVDHRGGFVNPIALNYETLLAARPRRDGLVRLANVEASLYPPQEFVLEEELPPRRLVEDDPRRRPEAWDRWTFERFQARREAGVERDWSNYLKAALVYFQDLFRHQRTFEGMEVMVYGNVPPSAGLSSSSSLLVAAAEMALALNGLSLPQEEFILHCGWGEWYVGTRGGSGDHAAIKLGRRGHLSHIGSRPFRVEYVPFPAEYRLLLADSKETAHKAGGARDHFNQRVAAYEIGFLLWQKEFPQHRERMVQLRDVNPETLGVPLAEIYRMVKALPERIGREALRERLPEQRERLEAIFASHAEPKEGYPVRGVCLFGIAECERSRLCVELLRRGEVAPFGQWMLRSHDGDRVSRWSPTGERIPWSTAVPDEQVEALIRWAKAGDPSAALHLQPGAYECSTERIDRMVDTVASLPGVAGAQLSGAGLGGAMMVLVHQDAVEAVQQALIEKVYQPLRLEPALYVCQPVAGSGLVG